MAKFEESNRRVLQGVFVCRRCKTKLRSNMQKILLGKVSCRKCGGKALRPKRKR